MKLVNHVALEVPLERAWAALLDVPRVAGALPGASVEPDGGVDGYRGRMKVKLGPASAEYTGLAALQDVDEDSHTATYRVRGREVHGQGEAAAVIRVAATRDGETTRVRVETELEVSGRQAQVGRGLMEEVAGGMLTVFADRLSDALTGAAPPSDAPFDAGRLVLRPILERAGFALAGLVVGLAVGRVVWRRR